MTVIEMQVLTVVRNCLPDIFKTLMRIADALEEANRLKQLELPSQICIDGNVFNVARYKSKGESK